MPAPAAAAPAVAAPAAAGPAVAGPAMADRPAVTDGPAVTLPAAAGLPAATHWRVTDSDRERSRRLEGFSEADLTLGCLAEGAALFSECTVSPSDSEEDA